MNRPSLFGFGRFSLFFLALGFGAMASGQASTAYPAQVAELPAFLAAAGASGNSAAAPLPAVPASSSSAVPEIDPALPADADTPSPAVSAAIPPETSSAGLPEAPSAVASRPELPGDFVFQAPGQATPNVAPKLTKYIPSGMTAQTLTAHDKVLVGLHDLYSPLNFLAMVASAGYEQALNGEPNYGTDRGAFGQRLGAAAIRESTQGLFTDSIFSSLLHEDPRYYVQGPSHNVVYRAVYAVTRVVVTRTDNGNGSVNGALLLGYASSAALSYTYYPKVNRDFHDTVATFGGSLGGAALGFAVSEFSDDLLKAVHLRKK